MSATGIISRLASVVKLRTMVTPLMASLMLIFSYGSFLLKTSCLSLAESSWFRGGFKCSYKMFGTNWNTTFLICAYSSSVILSGSSWNVHITINFYFKIVSTSLEHGGTAADCPVSNRDRMLYRFRNVYSQPLLAQKSDSILSHANHFAFYFKIVPIPGSFSVPYRPLGF